MTRTAIKFGAFVAVCVGFTAWLAFLIGNIQLFRAQNTYSATFDDVTGLLTNDNVKIAGVAVGKVTKVNVHDGRATVSFTVDRKHRVPTDSIAEIRWRNLIGQRYLYLVPGPASTMLENGDAVEATESVVDLGELFNRLGPIVSAVDPRQVNEFLDTITQALTGNEAKVSQAIDDLAVLAAALGERDQSIGRLIENLNTVAGTITTRDQQIRTMLDNLVLISETLSDHSGVIDDALTQFGTFSASLDTLLSANSTELDRLIANLAATTDTVKAKLDTVDSILGGLPTAAERVFTSSRLGEWLNQTILCPALTPPSGPGKGCPAPTVKGSDE